MVEHHLRVGHGAGEGQELAVLVVVVPRVVGEAARAEPGDPGAEGGILEQAGRRPARDHQTEIGLGTGQRVPDATEPSAARGDVRVEHVVELGGAQVGVADDGRDQSAALGRRRGHELALADGPERGRSVGAVPDVALHEDRRLHAVSRVHVGEQLGDRVRQQPTGGPEVMVRIDDPAVGIDDVLDDERAATRPIRGGEVPSAHRSR